MSNIPKLPKVFELGKPATKGVLDGNIVIQEKLDGSQFRILLTKDGWDAGSKKVTGKDKLDDMFSKALDSAEMVWERYVDQALYLKWPKLVLYCEYMKDTKHNTIEYERIPRNHLYLFGLFDLEKHEDVSYPNRLMQLAVRLNIETPNILYTGWSDNDIEVIKQYIDAAKSGKIPSKFGDNLIPAEGIVILNLDKQYDIVKYPMWNGFFMRAKVVREDFRELNDRVWKEKKKPLDKKIIDMIATPQKLDKVVQHLVEDGTITDHNMQNMKYIVDEFWSDILAEDSEEIVKLVIENIKSVVNKRLAQMYKGLYVGDVK